MLRTGDQDPRKSMPQSELDAANAYAMPQVGENGQDRLMLSLGLAALMMLGVFVFNQLSEGRREASVNQMMREARLELDEAQNEINRVRSDAALAKAEAERAQRLAALSSRRNQAVAVTPAGNALPSQSNLRSPALVIDNSRPRALGEEAAADGGASPAGDINGLTASDIFAQRVSAGGLDPVRATVIEDPSRVVSQGTIIAGVLETAINSDLPGFTRAIVSEDVRSLDNRTILIPRGSRLIGQYRSGLAIGESRAFVIWTRLLTPTGVSVELTSPATDTLGRAGLPGRVNRHFFQRFGSAILLSVIGAGTNALLYDSNSDIIIASSSEAQAIAAQALSQNINIPPTIKVDQGKEIRIFLARDLYFPRIAGSSELRP